MAEGTPLNDQELAAVFSPEINNVHIHSDVPEVLEHKIPLAAPTEVDSTGIPWDASIHAANKSKLKSGQWRKKPGGPVAIEPQPTAPVAPAPPPVPKINFDSVSTLINKILIEDLLTGAQTVAILQDFGVSNIVELSKQPELIEPVYQALQEAIA